MDTACVELYLVDGMPISVDTIAVENEIAENLYEQSELKHLIYNAPAEYTDLILNGNPVKYLKTVTIYKPFENWLCYRLWEDLASVLAFWYSQEVANFNQLIAGYH